MKFAVLLEAGEGGGYGAYSPDVPNVIAAGPTAEIALSRFEEGLRKLFEITRKEGGELPVARTIAATVEVDDVA